MSASPPPEPGFTRGGRPPRRKVNPAFNHFAHGEPMIWLNGGALALALVMIMVMLGYVFWKGSATFWPLPSARVQTHDGQQYLGESTRQEWFVPAPGALEDLEPEARAKALQEIEAAGGRAHRQLYRTGNFDLTGTRFTWVPDYQVARKTYPEWALVFERTEWGVAHGFPVAFREAGEVVAEAPGAIWARFTEVHPEVRRRWRQRQRLESREIGRVNRIQESARLAVVAARRKHQAGNLSDAALAEAEARYEAKLEQARAEHAEITGRIQALNEANERYVLEMETVSGEPFSLHLADIVRAFPPNRLGWWEKVEVYLSRWWEFLYHNPREANMEGGIFPAIVGTVLMTLVMTLFVVPFGVLAALYLREYAREGPLVSAIRIAINNLAGVPSIVFGVFGLGFFCYIVGGSIDEWFYPVRTAENVPTYRKGGVLWASLTLALLTLPVVIVATEEALAAVSSSMREGSYACGASRWQTIRRIVLPRAMPGIMTGTILAMARGAGEVAPLMLVGAVKIAPDLPLDIHDWSGTLGPLPTGPIHLERSFLHLGFHIYDVGFQSPDSEAARPMVFTTTLLLIGIIVVLNLTAMALRGRLRRKFAGSTF